MLILLIWLFQLPPLPDHGLFTAVLREHVVDGRVNYPAIREDSRFRSYIGQLEKSDPESIRETSERLAFWINAYNAFTIKVVVDHYPVKSIKDVGTGGAFLASLIGQTIWDKPFVLINRRLYSLNQIEHEIIRKQFQDPRIHFALVCAARSCPKLRSEAYEGDRLDRQLDDEGRKFINDYSLNRFDVEGRTVALSSIFKWYAGDFGASNADLLRFISRYLPPAVAGPILDDPTSFQIEFLDYDWSLND